MNIDDILNVDMTPLSSISTSGPDMSVSMSVELGASTAVDFGDRSREIQDTAAAMLELGYTVGASCFRNPSLVLVEDSKFHLLGVPPILGWGAISPQS